MLYINRPDSLQDSNNGASILVGPSTTDMNANTGIATIADINSGRFTTGTNGIDAQAIVLLMAAGTQNEYLNLYTLRVYLYPRATFCGVFLGSEIRDQSATVTSVSPDLVYDNQFCFGCLGGDTPLLDAQGQKPYILLTLGQTKTVRTVSIVGDYAYDTWLQNVVVSVLQDEDYDANGILTTGTDWYVDRPCMHAGWEQF